MALPEPTAGETREEFITRCTTDVETKNHFGGPGQRFSYCQLAWESSQNSQMVAPEMDEPTEVAKLNMPRPLYISRPVVNAPEIIQWAKSQGFKTAFPPKEMHVTVAYSKRPVDWFAIPNTYQTMNIPAGGPRVLEVYGGDTAVLIFKAEQLSRRHAEICQHGASWDYPDYNPHISITMNLKGIDLSKMQPYNGPIILGTERFEDINNGFNGSVTEKADVQVQAQVTKLDKDQRLAYGWASVIEIGGKPVVDLHNDVITEQTLITAAHQLITDSRTGKLMHGGKRIANMVESIVFTKDLQKALGIDLGKVGWFIGMYVTDDAVWRDVKSGKFPMFSIGGVARRTKI